MSRAVGHLNLVEQEPLQRRIVRQRLVQLETWTAQRRRIGEEPEADELAEIEQLRRQLDVLFDASDNVSRLVCVSAAEIRPSLVRWLWHNRIPLGAPTIIDGKPGVGKSTAITDIAARVTRGLPMPGDDPGQRAAAGVLVCSGEDSWSKVIRPRLESHGADLDRVHLVSGVIEDGLERDWTLADLTALERQVQEIGAALLVIDPMMMYFPRSTNTYRDQDVRALLGPLARMADRNDLAVVMVRHPTKGGVVDPVYVGSGSVGLSGAARSVLFVGREPGNLARSVLAVSKSSHSAGAPSLAFRIEMDYGRDCGHIEWEGAVDYSASRLLTGSIEEDVDRAIDIARDFLTHQLRGGSLARNAVFDRAHKSGLPASDRTLERAAQQLGIESKRTGFGPGTVYVWTLPVPAPTMLATRVPNVVGKTDGDHGDESGDQADRLNAAEDSLHARQSSAVGEHGPPGAAAIGGSSVRG
jgi:hypothetical protein